jgi:uncharacterized protein
VNHYPWRPGLPVPYVIALVELDSAPEVRLMTNIVECEPALVTVGMPVEVTFERCGEMYVPLFRTLV